jgi:hypothetical protein
MTPAESRRAVALVESRTRPTWALIPVRSSFDIVQGLRGSLTNRVKERKRRRANDSGARLSRRARELSRPR